MDYEAAVCPKCLEAHSINHWTRETGRYYSSVTSLETIISRFQLGIGDLEYSFTCPQCSTENEFKYLILIPGSHTNEDALKFLKHD